MPRASASARPTSAARPAACCRSPGGGCRALLFLAAAAFAAWRGIADSLEKSYVDVRMCGELDSLETDVATGRAEIKKTALDSKDARMEVSSFCDVEGLRIVLRVADARAVENGFAGGIGTECYFAPGAQLSAIRRRLVYDTCRTWSRAGHDRLSPFDRWRDPVIGDPEFYAARLKPLEDALAAQAGRVKAEMTDAEVDEVYEKGAKVWIGLDHVIDELRRQWLLAKYTEM